MTRAHVRYCGDHARRRYIAPKLPFRKPANKWTELVVTGAGKGRGCIAFATLQFICHQVVLKGGVEFWLQKGKKQIQEVDSMRIYGSKVILVVLSFDKKLTHSRLETIAMVNNVKGGRG